jgi:opacity protein-like surface antigen
MEGNAMKPQIFAAALLFATAGTASAFDLPPEVQAPEYTGTIAAASGWYIRGDLGYNASSSAGKPSWQTYGAANDTYASDTFDSARLDGDYSLSAGFGYQFNDFVRSDLTVDYFKSNFSGNSSTDSRCSALQNAGTGCAFTHKQALAVLDVMANGYIDLGTYWGLTPYLGAGAGIANIDWGDQHVSKHCTSGTSGCNNWVKYNAKDYDGVESWRFAYALMAGVSYDIATNYKLDFGYRYSDIASGDMFDWSKSESNKGASGVKGTDNGFGRHEIRVGLRMTGW